ncbi:hypothetical protein [Levilactobacillus brevis]|uniref:hypothetical protein n=1 Tax=Levilactobacillus brevis TaxID=1580 RepID=UPI00111865A3|nr:hypothetical protein [Levilactobacillus brevis]QCZ46817.1 Hypothetical protein UCCLB556_1942 [Levilactobacillus brevis]
MKLHKVCNQIRPATYRVKLRKLEYINEEGSGHLRATYQVLDKFLVDDMFDTADSNLEEFVATLEKVMGEELDVEDVAPMQAIANVYCTPEGVTKMRRFEWAPKGKEHEWFNFEGSFFDGDFVDVPMDEVTD